MLASLMRYRTASRAGLNRPVAAWVTNYPTRDRWRRTRVFVELFEGAVARADELGFQLEEFWMREGGMSQARANQILRARGISALLLAPQPAPGTSLELDWNAFSAVTIGYTLVSPRLHLAGSHQFASMGLLFRRLLEAGYTRIGLALPTSLDLRVGHGWLGGYLAEQASLPLARRLPPLRFDEFSADLVMGWVKRHRPDVVISATEEIWRAFKAQGTRFPEEIGYALPSLVGADDARAGIDEKARAVGSAAMDLLCGLWQRGERGVPLVPQRVLIEGEWRGGNTVRGL